MILNLVLFIYFVIAMVSISVGIKPDNPYSVDKSTSIFAIIINIIFTIVFVITLIKQSIVSDYPTIINYILTWFILDCILGIYQSVRDYNKRSITVNGIGRVYRIVYGIIVIIGILFIWL